MAVAMPAQPWATTRSVGLCPAGRNAPGQRDPDLLQDSPSSLGNMCSGSPSLEQPSLGLIVR